MLPPAAPFPQQIGRYVVQKELGRGAMGVVYRAHDPHTERTVAIKVALHPDQGNDWERFLREIRVSGALRHPNVVQLLDGGLAGTRPYLVMAYVDGEPLDARLKRELPPIAEAARIVRDVARGAAHAHAQGVLHRDIKPGNVLIEWSSGRPLLADFGLARAVGEASNLTRTGTAIGTPAFMPPEQSRGEKEKIGPRSDVYSLGATLFMALTGRYPFQDSPNLLGAIYFMEPKPPSAFRAEVPPELDRIVLRCLGKQPEERYGSATELADALEEFLEGFAPGSSGRARSSLAVGGLLAAAAAVGLGVWWTGSRPTPPQSVTETPTDGRAAKKAVAKPPPRPAPQGPVPVTVKASGDVFAVFDASGKELGRGSLAGERSPYRYALPLEVSGWAIGEVDPGSPGLEVVLLAHQPRYPALVAVATARGEVLRRYWHPGWLFGKPLLTDLDGDGLAEIVAGGTNNDAGGSRGPVAAVVCLDGRAMQGEAPPRQGRLGRGVERWYAVLSANKGEVHRLSREGRVVVAQGIKQRVDRIAPGVGPAAPFRDQVVALPEPHDPRAVALADLDGDGRQDLVVGCALGKAGGRVVLVRQGKGGFAAPDLSLAALKAPPVRVAATDVDGDGRVDIGVLLASGRVRVYRQPRPNAFARRAPHSAGAGYDLVACGPSFVVCRQGAVEQLRGARDGSLRGSVVAGSRGLRVVRLAARGRRLVGLTGDGRVARWSDTTLAPVLVPARGGAVFNGSRIALGAGQELAVITGRGGYLSLGREARSRRSPPWVGLTYFGRGTAAYLATLSAAGILTLRGAGLAKPERYALRSGARALTVGDVDGDGRPDLVVAEGDGVRVLFTR